MNSRRCIHPLASLLTVLLGASGCTTNDGPSGGGAGASGDPTSTADDTTTTSDSAPPASGPSCTVPGCVRSLEYLGPENKQVSWAEYDVDAYLIRYFSSAYGGAEIAGKVYVPVGAAPAAGWPAKVWSHGFGGLGTDFQTWPIAGDDFRQSRGEQESVFASQGLVSLFFWHPGAGMSEPFASYSPFNLDEGVAAAADGLAAVAGLDGWVLPAANAGTPGATLRIDTSRLVMSTNCVSSPLMVKFAQAYMSGAIDRPIRAIVSDTFQPSTAYITECLGSSVAQLTNTLHAAGMYGLWQAPLWALAESNGWPLTEFFSDEAIAVLSAPTESPACPKSTPKCMSLNRSARHEPPAQSQVAAPILAGANAACHAREGRDCATGLEIATWLYSPKMLLLSLQAQTGGIPAILANPFYQQYFADIDPFFAPENIEAFALDVPLFVVSDGTTEPEVPGIPPPAERHGCMTVPRLEELGVEWGWNIRNCFREGPDEGTYVTETSAKGIGNAWTMCRLADALYPDGLPPELSWRHRCEEVIDACETAY